MRCSFDAFIASTPRLKLIRTCFLLAGIYNEEILHVNGIFAVDEDLGGDNHEPLNYFKIWIRDDGHCRQK